MGTWAQLLSDTRVDLKDTSTTKRWNDDMLFLWLRDAIRDYSSYFPRRVNRLALTEESGAYPLPTDFVDAVYVECPEDNFLEQRQERPGQRYITKSIPTLYYLQGGCLYLNGDSLDGVWLTYDAIHLFPTNVLDTSFTLSVPEKDEELIRLYVKGKATEQLRTQQSSMDRFKLGSGDRQDNPMEPEVGNLMNDYYRKIAERLRGGTISLYRTGRR